MRVRGGVVWVCAAAAALAGVVSAEPLYRLRGKILTASGDAVAGAALRVEARFGFGGEAAEAARAFFHRAQDRDPKSFGAALGMASTALLQKDFDTAARAFGAARELTTNKAEQAYLTAAIRDLSKLHVTAPGSH